MAAATHWLPNVQQELHMPEQFLVTLTGPYQPGVMNRLAALTHQYQGKWLSNKMANLEGRFAAIIKIELPSINTADLKKALADLPDIDATFHPKTSRDSAPRHPVELKIDARDQPGLVNEITKVISAQDICIDRMSSHRISVPETGSTVFTAELSLTLPAHLGVDAVVADLEALYPHLIVRIADASS